LLNVVLFIILLQHEFDYIYMY